MTVVYGISQPSPVHCLHAVRDTIGEVCVRANRDIASVTLIAVSKTVSAEVLEPFVVAGQRVFGENRVQEAADKWPRLSERYRDGELHLIGPLQTNKVREAVALFRAIHSVDRPHLCEALARECEKQGRRRPTLFVEVNTGAEPQKAGILPDEADQFIAACKQTYGLEIAGLMCIPPANEPPANHFALLAHIAARNGLKLLSMGMSADFPLAIQYGATDGRAGTAIFGARMPRADALPAGPQVPAAGHTQSARGADAPQ